MARILPGAAISDIRGKVGGSVFQRSAQGLTMRAKTSPINPRSIAQSSQRSLTASLQTTWQQLEADDRVAWESWSIFQGLTVGQFSTSGMSGQQAFILVNTYLLLQGVAGLTSPIFTPYNLPTSLAELVTDTDNLSILFPDMPDEATYTPIVRISLPLQPARNAKPAGTRLLLPTGIRIAQNWSITDAYKSRFGFIPSENDILWVEYGFQQIDNGTLSIFAQTKLVVGT